MNVAETAKLAAAARVLGFLLQRELDAQSLAVLRGPEIAGALAELGLQLPRADDQAALDSWAAEYFEIFVAPNPGPPPIQSLVQGGSYEGKPAAAMRELAAQLGLDRRSQAARGAPPDHLGAQLELWAEVAERAPDQGAAFARSSLAWSLPWLRRQATGRTGFYGRLCAVVADLVEVCRA